MWTESVPIDLLPDAPRVFIDYATSFERVRDFFAYDYSRPDAYAEAARLATTRALDRDGLAAVLAEQVEEFGGSEVTRRHAAALRDPESVCVVTGQQPSLFGGPLFVLYKAATAVKLARQLEERSGRRHVPVFWIANDDHRINEVDHIHVLDAEGALVRVDWVHGARRTQPLSALRLDTAVEDALAEVARTLRPSPHKNQVLELLIDTYRAGVSLSVAFARLLTRLFAEQGLVVTDPTDRRLRHLGMPRLADELAYPSPTTEAARVATAELEQRGYPAQVKLRDDRLHLFYGDSDRFRVRCGPGGLQSDQQTGARAETELREHFLAAPEEFTTNVLLRPLYQDALLPTVAYVAGPGEVAYYAQLGPVYERFGLPMPVIFPRKSVTLVNAKARRLLGASGLRVRDAFEAQSAGFLATSDDGVSLEAAFERLRAHVDDDTSRLAEELADLDPALAARARSIIERMLTGLSALERRAGQSHSRRSGDRQRQVAWLEAYLFPNREPQERVLGIVQGLIDGGLDLVQTVIESIELGDRDHQVFYAHADRPVSEVAGAARD